MLEYEISPGDAAALLSEGKARLIDVREPWEFATTRVEGPRGRIRSWTPMNGWW